MPLHHMLANLAWQVNIFSIPLVLGAYPMYCILSNFDPAGFKIRDTASGSFLRQGSNLNCTLFDLISIMNNYV